jgi:hypothetical protein
MSCDLSVNRPIDSFIRYFVGDAKPYHTKILEIVENYVFRENIEVDFTESVSKHITLENRPGCQSVGFGVNFDGDCGFDALSCCDLFQCIGGYGLVFDNSDLLATYPVTNMNHTTGVITVQGAHLHDTYLNIKSVPNNRTIIVSGDQSEYFDSHALFWVVKKRSLKVLSKTDNQLLIEGSHVDILLQKRDIELNNCGRDDGLFSVVTAVLQGGNTLITLGEYLSSDGVLGVALVDTNTKNNGIYQVDSYAIENGDTVLTLFSETKIPLTDADVNNDHGSIRLRTGLIHDRKIWIEGSSSQINNSEWKIVGVAYDATNDSTLVTVDGTLEEAGEASVKIYGYMTGAGFDGLNECSRPNPFTVHTSISELLQIFIIPISPTPTPTPTASVSPTLSATPTVTLSRTPPITKTPTPTPTPSSTVPMLCSLDVVDGQGVVFSEAATYYVDTGSDLGFIQITFKTGTLPQKLTVFNGDEEVFTTGYYGDQSLQQNLDSILLSNGMPVEQIQKPNGGVNEYQYFSFEKDTAYRKVTVEVYSPFGENSTFSFSLNCPAEVEPTPTPTLTPTLTPTMTPSEGASPTPTPTGTVTPTATVSVTPTSTLTPTPTPSVTPSPVLCDKTPFDYAVFQTSWVPANGEDLDPHLQMVIPDRKSIIVGWNRQDHDQDYVQWAGDHQGSTGQEGFLINLNRIKQDYPEVNQVTFLLTAFWYTRFLDGNVRTNITSYRGGEMFESDHTWVNIVGSGPNRPGRPGVPYEDIEFYSHSSKGVDEENGEQTLGSDLATIIYDFCEGRFLYDVLVPAITPTPMPTPSNTATPSMTPTPSISVTPSITVTASITPTISYSATASATPPPSASIPATPQFTFPTPTVTPTISQTVTPSISVTPSITVTISITPTISHSPTPSLTAEVTPSITPSITISPSNPVTPSVTPSTSFSASPTPTMTPSITVSASNPPTPTVTPTISFSASPSPTAEVTPTTTQSLTPTPETTKSLTPTVTPTLSESPSPTPTVTPTITLTPAVSPVYSDLFYHPAETIE